MTVCGRRVPLLAAGFWAVTAAVLVSSWMSFRWWASGMLFCGQPNAHHNCFALFLREDQGRLTISGSRWRQIYPAVTAGGWPTFNVDYLHFSRTVQPREENPSTHVDVPWFSFRNIHESSNRRAYVPAYGVKQYWDSEVPVTSARTGVELMFPSLLLALPPLLVAGRLTFHFLRQVRRRRSGFCRQCGYDLRMGDVRCPECGAVTLTVQATAGR